MACPKCNNESKQEYISNLGYCVLLHCKNCGEYYELTAPNTRHGSI